MGHTLLRVLELFLVNTLLYVHAEVENPEPTLTADKDFIQGRNNVTLTCSVEGSADWTVWKYDWFKRTSDSSEAQSIRNGVPDKVIDVSEGGLYHCRGGREDTPFYTEKSNEVTIQKIFSNKVSLTLQPNWPQIFRGETITLRCEIQGDGGSDWTYEWTPDRLNTPSTNNEYRISRATESDSGDYWCKGRRDSYSSTEWSNRITLTVSSRKPEPRLTTDNIPVRGTVRLTCSVEDSAGWKYDWFKRTSDSSKAQSIRNGVPDKVIEVSEGGLYHCRGGRGDPLFYTEESNEVTVQKTVSNKASLTVQPNWPQIFRGETITLRCQIEGGGGTDWTYEWTSDRLNTSSTNSEYRISSATESDSGEYRCIGRRDYSFTEWSDPITLTVSSNRPKAELSADDRDIPVGGSVTLTCSVKTSSSGWKYFWYRGEKTSEPLNTQDVLLSTGQISVSQEGVYWCRGGRGEPVYYTEYSDSISINKNVVNKAVVTLQPNWSEIFSGETITLRCEIKNGGDTEWEYEWKTTSSEKPSNQKEVSIRSASGSHSGDYRCKGRNKNKQSTDWSDPIKLTVSDEKLKPVLTVSPLWLNAGDSVTLNCEVEHPSTGWRFYWYKTVPKLPDYSYSFELLPGSSNGTEQDSYIVHGQTGTARYVCRAGRGDPVYYTEYSEPKFVWSRDFHSSASLTVSPDRVQHFTFDSVSLNCEGNSTEWRVRRHYGNSYPSYCSWGTMTGSTCNMYTSWQHDGVYWCESGSGEFSNAVNISVQNINIILVSPVHPVTEGDPVSLSCKLRTGIFDSNVFFYRNDELIQNDTRKELNISAVSKSDEGFYKCQYSGKESSQSWMSVKAVPRPESSSFPVLLILGLVCGIVLLLLLLLLLYHFRPFRDSCFRQIKSENTNQDTDTNHPVNQNEAQHDEYSSPFHDSGGSQDVTYSLIELKNRKKEKEHEPEESSVYANVKTGTEDDNLMYAQVNCHNKGKASKNKGKSHPAATDETVYSEVKVGSALGL